MQKNEEMNVTKGAKLQLFRPRQRQSMHAGLIWSCQENKAEHMREEPLA